MSFIYVPSLDFPYNCSCHLSVLILYARHSAGGSPLAQEPGHPVCLIRTAVTMTTVHPCPSHLPPSQILSQLPPPTREAGVSPSEHVS